MTTKYIRLQVICVVPVPPEVRDSLDTVAEAGLSALRDHLEANITTMVPGTLHTSWQSMPQSWQPKRPKPVLEEEVAPGFFHQVDSEERVTFVDVGDPDLPLDELRDRYASDPEFRRSVDAALGVQRRELPSADD